MTVFASSRRLAAVLVVLAASVALGQEQGVTVQVPDAVRATITAEVGKGQITEVKREQQEEKTVYAVGAVIDDVPYELHIREDGLLLHLHQQKEDANDGDRGAGVEGLPAAVRDGLQKAAGGAPIERVEEQPQTYTAHVTRGNHRYRITVDARGKLVEKEYEGEREQENAE